MKKDPFPELLDHEIGKLRTMAALTQPAKGRGFSGLSYIATLNVLSKHMQISRKRYNGKKFRRSIQEWSQILIRDGQRKLYLGSGTVRDEGRASIAFSKAIINAFKKL